MAASRPRRFRPAGSVSDGVLAIAITLLILDVRVDQAPGETLAIALRHALPQILAYAASFLQTPGGAGGTGHDADRTFDRVTLVRIIKLGSVLGNDHVVSGCLRVS